MDMQLTGKKALITGGSRGLGRAIAQALAREGVSVALVARHEEPLKAAAEEIAQTTRQRAVPFVCDMMDGAAIDTMVAAAADALGGLDILVNAASRVSGGVPEDVTHVTDDLILNDFVEKYLGYFRAARAAWPWLKQSSSGRIINVAGLAARQPGSLSAGARNIAVVSLTKNLAWAFGRDGITVNAIHPGTVVTDSFRSRMEAQAVHRGVSYEEHVAQLERSTALGRLPTAEDVANVAVFFASPLSGAVTGEVIAVSAGSPRAVFI
ncbi:MAG: SDR family oxidoreductase [Firmicutes bacterium]|nr:SDR family oxidoreductase [Bacillota bacterium]